MNDQRVDATTDGNFPNMRVIGGVLLLILLAACTSSHEAKRTGPGATTTSTSATTATSAPTASSIPGTASAGPSACTTATLAIGAGESQGAAGHWSSVIVFRNTTAAKCRISGYPGVAGLDAEGRQIAQAVRTPTGFTGGLGRGNHTPPIVDLAAGETAAARVEGTNIPTGTATSCPHYSALLVTPPGETHSVKLAVSENGCSGLEVHPVLPGTSGSVEQ